MSIKGMQVRKGVISVDESGNSNKDIEEIMSHYLLKVNYCEKYGNLWRVYTNNGVFALKAIPPQPGMAFIRHMHRIYQRGYNRIVPIFPANDGRYAVLHKNRLYYLMPWLPNDEISERSEKHKQMFRELARIHSLSVKEIEVNKEERKDHYEQTLDEWKKNKEFSEEFLQSCERKTYMSPFELMYCMYYFDVSQALDFSIKKFEEWYEATKEKDKVRTVIVHGKLSSRHFVYDDRGYGYFLNMENSRVAPPHTDLLPFLVRSMKTYPVVNTDIMEWLYTYFKYFSFRDGEMELFMAYLAHPGYFISALRHFQEKKGTKTELWLLKNLQFHYWQLKNTEYVVMKLEELEQQKKAAAQQQAQA
ncbi:spore coat protein YsxE [Peribacillus kribbensis]|uniref:spore coat protein YsxE n=1 Tax=Peribacillus kribbensis TaxID=356658 RepID=UPI001FE02DE8|nr:spore coat protein YsxE [Peribacillus kribbensis]